MLVTASLYCISLCGGIYVSKDHCKVQKIRLQNVRDPYYGVDSIKPVKLLPSGVCLGAVFPAGDLKGA